jgi:hypothetical protein
VNDEFLSVWVLIVFSRPSCLSYSSRYVKRILHGPGQQRVAYWREDDGLFLRPQRAAATASASVDDPIDAKGNRRGGLLFDISSEIYYSYVFRVYSSW